MAAAFVFDIGWRVSTSLETEFDLNSLDWVSLNCTECGHSVEILRLDLEYQSEATSDCPVCDCPVCGSTRSIPPESDAAAPEKTDAGEPTEEHSLAASIVAEKPPYEMSAEADETGHDSDPTVCADAADEVQYSDDEWDDPAVWQSGAIEDALPEIQPARRKRRKRAPQGVRQRLAAWFNQRRGPAAAALVSSLVHALVLLLLALIAVQLNQLTGANTIDSSFSAGEMELVEMPDLPPVEMALANGPAERHAPEGVDVRRVMNGDGAVISTEDIVLRDPSEYSTASWGIPSGGGFEGRRGEHRARLAEAHGGTPESEAAVEAGLAWLALHQNGDGSWNFHNYLTSKCGPHCSRPGRV